MNIAGNQHAANNVMRHEYRELSDPEKDLVVLVKDRGLEFYTLLENMGQSREISIAKTKIEEAVMWATKHITNK